MQINPHFLYNALDSIAWMALVNSQTGIVNMVKALSDIFRYSIKNEDTLATLSEELECLNNYIKFQQYRYENRLNLELDIEDEFLSFMVPKCILQPLVENSILHNIEEISSKVNVKIHAGRVENHIELRVEDNGSCCDIDMLNRFLSGEENVFNSQKTGIRNVNERIKLQYGSRSGLKYQAGRDGGTAAVIVIYTENEGN